MNLKNRKYMKTAEFKARQVWLPNDANADRAASETGKPSSPDNTTDESRTERE